MRKTMVLLAVVALAAATKVDYPLAAKRPVIEVYGTQKFEDDYQWLENASDPAVQAWVTSENRLTRSILDAVPQRAELARRLTALLDAPRLSYYGVTERGGKLFAMKSEPKKQQPSLVVFDAPDDAKSERVLFDPNAADAKGSIAIDFYVPSTNASRVAVSLSRNGSEDGSVHVIDVAAAKELGDVVPRVNYPTAGGSVAWNADSSGFWYTRYPQGNERTGIDVNFYQQIWFHAVGTPASADTYAIGRELPRIAETELATSDDGRFVLASVKNGDGGEVEHFVRGVDGKWTQTTRFSDQVRQADFGADNALYMLSHENAPNGKILRVTMDAPKISAASTILDTSRAEPLPDGVRPAPLAMNNSGRRAMSVDGFTATKNVLYVAMMAGGPSQLLTFDRSGHPLGPVPIPQISSVYEMVRTGSDDVLFRDGSYTAPAQWYRYSAATKKVSPAALRTVSPADFSDAVVVRESATSADGTQVPINIIYKKGTKLDGTHPAILRGYGGYSISTRPGVSLPNRLLLDAGVVIAYANIRGGGEYGESWHEAGKMLRKQNVFDDFAACAMHLVNRRYTIPARLAIEGGSNGGLLMGVELTQHPEMFRAVVSHVGLYDVPRWLRTPNGVFNTTEFGSPDDPQQLRAIMAYSPYHHVVSGTRYPAALFLTGDNDGRVDPMNSRKFVARLQAATASPRPILLRTTSSAGHGIGTSLSEAVASETDVFAFLWRELGM